MAPRHGRASDPPGRGAANPRRQGRDQHESAPYPFSQGSEAGLEPGDSLGVNTEGCGRNLLRSGSGIPVAEITDAHA